MSLPWTVFWVLLFAAIASTQCSEHGAGGEEEAHCFRLCLLSCLDNNSKMIDCSKSCLENCSVDTFLPESPKSNSGGTVEGKGAASNSKDDLETTSLEVKRKTRQAVDKQLSSIARATSAQTYTRRVGVLKEVLSEYCSGLKFHHGQRGQGHMDEPCFFFQAKAPPTKYVLPAADKESAAVIYLCCADDDEYEDMKLSLRLLDRYFVHEHRYPVLIFSDFLTSGHKDEISSLGLSFRPEHIAIKFDESVVPAGVNEMSGMFDMGYRHMSNFFSWTLFHHPALENYEWYWRLDTDSFLLGPVYFDVFDILDRSGIDYAFLNLGVEAEEYTVNLWETIQKHMEKYNITPTFLHNFIEEDGKFSNSYFYTNFEITRLSKWRNNKNYKRFYETIRDSGGIFKHRWGDAVLHLLYVALHIPESRVYSLTSVPYWHQQLVWLPANASVAMPA